RPRTEDIEPMEIQPLAGAASLEESYRGSLAGQRIALLLDMGPLSWGTREEFFARLCAAIRQRGGTAVIVFSGSVPDPVREELEARGIEFRADALARGKFHYRRLLQEVFDRHGINLASIRFFTYFSPIPWIVRALGVKRILFTEATSGTWDKKWWKVPLMR